MTKGFVFATVLILFLSIWVGNSDYSEDVDINSEPCIGKDARLTLGSYFTQNQGQIPVDEVYFHSQNAYFSTTGVIFRVFEESNELTKDTQEPLAEPSQPENMHVYEMRFIDPNYVIPVGKEKLPQKSNFFLGNDPSKWAADVPNYREIIYENLYDNIDLVYRTVPQGLKYEFVVHPGGEVEHIKMKYKSVELSTDGSNLFLKTSVGTVTDGWLYSYQVKNTQELQVEAKIIVKDNIVYYDVDYDAEYTLVIDPLLYSTYIGGSGTDGGDSIRLDNSNNAYVAGSTSSPNFPTT
ncbi:MAG: SBBP repeat-containing protein, partial [Thermoplasmata archaeon]|nr:SBBP repeat-containing protein [Thermoplasmata archaeon]